MKLRLKGVAATSAIAFLVSASFAVSQDSKPDRSQTELDIHIQRVENGLPAIDLGGSEPPLHLNLTQLMDAFKVPGLSLAVIDNFKVAWAKGYGVGAVGSHSLVTVHTLFQAGSISKPVSATGALYLVEHGKLSLDENVNAELKSWHVPDNEFTKEQKVTLRRLLSHSAGLTVHGFPGYEVGSKIPTTVQVLNGEAPANSAPVRVVFVPGTKYAYSGGGVTIEQLLITDVTGRSFPQFMRETVLDKIGMSDSTFEQPLPAFRAATAATGADGMGMPIPGKWHIYPEMAAAGLWTTATDLAKFGIETALSKQGKANHVLSESMTRQMLTPQIEHRGLGFEVGEYKNAEEFGHSGDDAGFVAFLIMFADSGKGVAIMTNSDLGGSVAEYLIESVAKEYGWNYTPDPPYAASILSVIANLKGSQTALARYVEMKQAGPSQYTVDENTLISLGYHLLYSGQTDAAIQAFRREVQDYPKYWNSYDSLGEAYMKAGQKDLAIQNYEKSLELNPENATGLQQLKKLREQK